jgi:hypothetical protein
VKSRREQVGKVLLLFFFKKEAFLSKSPNGREGFETSQPHPRKSL